MKMKRLAVLVLTLALSGGALTACNSGKSGNTTANTTQTNQTQANETSSSRNVKVDTMGLSYTIPELWTDYMDSNIYFESLSSDTVLGKLTYYFVGTQDYEDIKKGNPLADISSYLYPMCAIIVVQKDNVESSAVKTLFQQYESREQMAAYGDYVYYFLSEPSKNGNALTEPDKTRYLYLRSGISQLKQSIAAYPFDPSVLQEQKTRLKNTITFVTKTLEGDAIDSTVFANYDVTMLNLTAAYATQSHDESAVMQELYTKLKADYPNVNLIQGIIDAPNTDAEQIMKEAKAAASGQYTSIVMDDLLRNWVTNNLPGVPVTVMIDSDGTIIGEMIKGAKTTDEYMTQIQAALAEVKARKK